MKPEKAHEKMMMAYYDMKEAREGIEKYGVGHDYIDIKMSYLIAQERFLKACTVYCQTMEK